MIIHKENEKPIKNANLGNTNVKNSILHYLAASNLNLSTRYSPITKEEEMDYIRDNDYIICPRFSGVRSWIIFTIIDGKYYAVNFPKHSQRKVVDLVIHPVEIECKRDFYFGTIMEGIFFVADGKKHLVIDEVYKFAGQSQLLKPKSDRLRNLASYLSNFINTNTTYTMCVSMFYRTTKTELKDLFDKIKAESNITEIVFYPNTFGSKVYSYTIIGTDLVENVVKLATFYMVKTTKPDVYDLLSPASNNKIDIAFVPDTASSHRYRQWFKKKKAKLLVECQMNFTNKMWVPIEIVDDS